MILPFIPRFMLIAFVLACGTLICGGSQVPQPETLAARSELSQSEVKRLLRKRQQQIGELLMIAKHPVENEELTATSAKVLAIDLLGEFRAEDAVEFLVQNVGLFVPRSSFDISPGANYPCVQALVSIGLPAIKGIFKQMDTPVTEKELKLFAAVILLVDGKDIGLLRVENAAKGATDKNKDNFLALVQVFKPKK